MTLLNTGLLELKQQYHLHVAPLTPYRIVLLKGSLSNNDGDGYENVTNEVTQL